MATADEGYFLTPSPLLNPEESDAVFQRILSGTRCNQSAVKKQQGLDANIVAAYLPPDVLSSIKPNLNQFASEAISPQINGWIGNAETQQPYVKTRNVWGSRYDRDRLMTSEGWKQLGKWGLKNGYVLSYT